MISSLTKPILFAHRGASAYAPENTLAAFNLAIRQKADAIELDVKLTGDEKVIVIHDDTVNRTTNGKGAVRKLDLKTIKSLDAGQYFDDTFRGEKVPTLYEVLESIAERILLNIEIANYSSPFDQLPQKTADVIKSYNQEKILISSFNPISLLKIHKLLPDLSLGLLTNHGVYGILIRALLGNFIPYTSIHPDVNHTNNNLIERYHKKGLRIHPYTVNDYESMVNLFKWNVDGIFTDDIPLAIKARDYLK